MLEQRPQRQWRRLRYEILGPVGTDHHWVAAQLGVNERTLRRWEAKPLAEGPVMYRLALLGLATTRQDSGALRVPGREASYG